jgi:hypothetical protein
MSKELWKELSGYDIFPFEESIPDDVRFKHTKNYIDFNHNICFALPFYQDVVDYEMGSKKGHLKYMTERENTILRLITGLEVYLVDTFRMISKSVTFEMIDRSKLVDFVKEFRSEKEYFHELKKSSGAITLDKIIPKRIDLQQKEKCKIAYLSIGVDVTSITGNDLVIWNKIFNGKNGYMQMRHQIVHGGSLQTYGAKINADYIRDAALDIVNFIYNGTIDLASDVGREHSIT